MSFGDGDLHERVAALEARVFELELLCRQHVELERGMLREMEHVRDDIFLMDYYEREAARLSELV